MQKVDFKKDLKLLYRPSAKDVALVDVPAMNFLLLDGAGDPNTSPAYAAAVQALFTVSYALKFMVKRGPLAIDYGVMPLEGLWWADDMSAFTTADKSSWHWTMMIMQPALVTPDMVAQAITASRKKVASEALDKLRFEAFCEGLCAQILHIGPFSAEGPSIERVHHFIQARGVLTGKHHEIYLSDIRKADPARWKTIIRQPMKAEAHHSMICVPSSTTWLAGRL
jgi:hypothetical protein